VEKGVPIPDGELVNEMSKARKEAAKRKSAAQKAATRANKQRSANVTIDAPNSEHELLERGARALSSEDFTIAIKILREAIRLIPQNPESVISRGIAYANLGQHDFALAACEMALQIEPEHSIALENRRAMLAALGLPNSTVVKI
jgi:tetratricopeptide (TPR) repeat protein